jgi:hypothetical protein
MSAQHTPPPIETEYNHLVHMDEDRNAVYLAVVRGRLPAVLGRDSLRVAGTGVSPDSARADAYVRFAHVYDRLRSSDRVSNADAAS